ncbi:MAG: S16 family serine protease [Candidatus Nanopelagicales bacterium]
MVGLVRRHLPVLVLLVTLTACSTGDTTQQVSALWYGRTADGEVINGVTPVEVATDHAGDGPFSVDLTGFADAGADEVWASSAWSGATVAMLATGQDPSGWAVRFGLEEDIDGPSASALLAATVQSGVEGTRVSPQSSMTGVILPNGAILAVTGISEKLQAAAAAGITTVVIPRESVRQPDLRTGVPIDVRDVGRGLGIRVVPVDTLGEAYAVLTGQPAPPPAPPMVQSPALSALVARETRRTLRRLDTGPATGASRRAAGLLADDRVFAAYAVATQAEIDVLVARAEARTLRAARGQGLQPTRRAVAAAAATVGSRSEKAIADAAATPLRFVEQFAALPDALTWGTGNLALLALAQRSAAAGSEADVVRAAGQVASARYRLRHYLPVQLRAVGLIGRIPATDPDHSVAVLDAYAALLGQAGEANLRYASAVAPDPLLGVAERAQAQADLWHRQVATDRSQASVMRRMAAALSFFVAAVNLVSMEGRLVADGASDGQVDEDFFARQVDVATHENAAASAALEHAGYDSSYVAWGDAWGRALADPDTGAVLVRNRGLTYQWYATVQGRLALALGR